MANLTETSTWETGVYRLETSDPVQGGAGGISNTQPNQLANRTKKIYDTLAEYGIFITLGEQTFTGQNVIQTSDFEATVVDDDVVYYHVGNAEFTKAIADGSAAQYAVGIADVTNGKVITSGLVQTTRSDTGGDILYLSDTVAGAITTTATDIAIGRYEFDGIITFVSAAASTATAASIPPGSITESQLSFTIYTASEIDAKCSNWDSAYTDRLKWDGGATGLDATTGRTSLGLVGDVTTHSHDGMYYTETEIDAKCTNWDTAYTDRLKWDGGATGLNASTARTSLGLTGDVTTHNHDTQYPIGTIATQDANNVSITGGTISMPDGGIMVAGDVTAAQNRVVNVYATTGAVPAASSVKRGTIYIKYTA